MAIEISKELFLDWDCPKCGAKASKYIGSNEEQIIKKYKEHELSHLVCTMCGEIKAVTFEEFKKLF